MRMMTGAILILAASLLMCVYQLRNDSPELSWMKWYSIILTGVGAAFMVWGLWLDLSVRRWRDHRRHKGDT